MISPTPLAVLAMLAGLPLFVAVALFAPALWPLAAGWIVGLGGLIGIDALLAARLSALRLNFAPPPLLGVGGQTPLPVTVSFEKGPLPARFEAQLETGARLSQPALRRVSGFDGRSRRVDFTPDIERRGLAEVKAFWIRWTGPLGLAAKQHLRRYDITIPVTPDIAFVQEEAVRIYDRNADFGSKIELDRGAGTEFDALREFAAGMDRRAIDWKHSARHMSLLAKEYRTERNHTLVMAFDTGRLMSEPLVMEEGKVGLSRLDRAIHAGLLLSHVSLRAGDWCAFYGFDARPQISARPVSGPRAFAQLQALAARLEYGEEEANYTLALADLATSLNRRALVVLFTDFVDTISAEIMLDNIQRLSKRHHVLFTTFRDPLITRLTGAAPMTADDVSRAVIAEGLQTERQRVFTRLGRMGVDVLEADASQFGARLISRYLEIKRRESL